ncbi:MAG TPA: MAPEG family protein [Rhizomicrobium sp.]|nr:MAPEG family protein [Rhizomicrobium sp.]
MTLFVPAVLLTAVVTVLAILFSVGTGLLVARVRRRVNIFPPVMTGAPELERALRIQGNTLEQFVLFVPALWLATVYFQGWIPPVLGLVWCLGRIIYVPLYLGGKNRFPGFALTIFPTLILTLLAIIGIVQAWMGA